MRPRNQNKRLALIGGFGVVLALGIFLIIMALGQSVQFFYNPSEIHADDFIPKSETIKVGGYVMPDSLVKDDKLSITFLLADFNPTEPTQPGSKVSISVTYMGVLPDLFAEGAGAVAIGRLVGPYELKAERLLAKHDENYQPIK